MNPSVEPVAQVNELESCIARFESAWRESDSPEISRFLPPPDAAHYEFVLVELACIDLELAWAAGHRRHVEVYLAEYPQLKSSESAVRQLAEQEFQSRRDAGDHVDAREYERRLNLSIHVHPKPLDTPSVTTSRIPWRERIGKHYDEHCKAGSTGNSSVLLDIGLDDEYPCQLQEGESFGGFRLRRELGRGSFGRVFLAEQAGLANRSVVLKIGKQLFDESQNLAQLLHTNIVPIYSTHRVGEYQAICMPYLGSTTLADWIRAETQKQSSIVDQAHVPTHERFPGSTLPMSGSNSRDNQSEVMKTFAIAQSNTAQLDITGRLRTILSLCQGLVHAHERGIIHRDLKPANVLLADDGTPVLLDFNLALRDREADQDKMIMGGTIPYMAPEQLEGLRDSQTTIDARSDVYALGVMLFEVLSGRHPFRTIHGKGKKVIDELLSEQRRGPPDLREFVPEISPAVAAIAKHCLEPDRDLRYTSARELTEDLHRHLSDQPLLHIPEPSLRERASKFQRRHAGLLAGILSIGLAVVLVASIALVFAQSRRANRAEAITTRDELMRDGDEARSLLSLPYPAEEELSSGLEICERALARYGVVKGQPWSPNHKLWSLSESEQLVVCNELAELLCLIAHGETLSSPELTSLNSTNRAEHSKQNAAAWLTQFSSQLTSLQLDFKTLLPSQQPRELVALGRFRAATEYLDTASREHPENAALWAQLGACRLALGETHEALSCYTAYIALRPTSWRPYLWRAQANLDLQRFVHAERDLNTLLELQPDHVPALTFRALARIGTNDLSGAEIDLDRAIELRSGHTRLFFMRARVRKLLGDEEAAKRDWLEGMQRKPADEISFIARGVARIASDPQGAIADFDAAIQCNLWSREARQNKAHVLSEQLSKTEDAIEVLEPIVERFPEFVPSRIGRAVLLARVGKREQSLKETEAVLRLDDRPLTLYQAACVHALNSKLQPDDSRLALELLERSLQAGFDRNIVLGDPDLASLRSDPEFTRLVGESEASSPSSKK